MVSFMVLVYFSINPFLLLAAFPFISETKVWCWAGENQFSQEAASDCGFQTQSEMLFD